MRNYFKESFGHLPTKYALVCWDAYIEKYTLLHSCNDATEAYNRAKQFVSELSIVVHVYHVPNDEISFTLP